MRFLLLLLLLCPAAWSHSVDLTGAWRVSPPGDDASWARPDFADSSWKTVLVPLGDASRRMPERYWLRRQVSLPEGTEAEPLTITVGAVSEFYEVFVNGVSLGKSQAFEISAARLGRPQTFDVPRIATRGRELAIAIRVWQPLGGPNAWHMRDEGPWLLTDSIAAPRSAGAESINSRRATRYPDLIQTFIALTAALVVLLVWTGNRRRHDLLWLFVYTIAICMGRLDLILQISTDTQPFGREALRYLEFALVPAVLFAQFVSSAFALRWLAILAWPTFALTSMVYVLSGVNQDWSIAGLWLIQAGTLAAMIRAALQKPLGKAVSNTRFLLLILLLATFYFHGTTWGRWGRLEIPDLRFLQVFGVTIALQIGSVTLLALVYALSQVRNIVADRIRLGTEFEAARALQQLLLRDSDVQSGEYEVRAIYRPAQEVGGDFYQLTRLEDGGLLVLVGDVSGKGLHAAMLVATVVGALRRERSTSPAEVLTGLNDALAGQTANGFVTACCVHVRPGGDVLLANAGHPPPYSGGRELEVEAGLPLGVMPATTYTSSSFHLQPGESLTLVSDGVPEAAKNGQLFGFERTCEISRKPAAEIADAAETWGQNDDITVVKVKRASA